MKRINPNTDFVLVPGKVYIGSWDNNTRRVIFKPSTDFLGDTCHMIAANDIYMLSRSGCCTSDNTQFREATHDEIIWLEACIAENRTVPLEEVLKKAENSLIIDEYYTVTNSNGYMIGKVTIPMTEDSKDGYIRGRATVVTNFDNQKEFSTDDVWCYKSADRTFRKSTSDEIQWLDGCIKADKYIPKEEVVTYKEQTMTYKFKVGDKVKTVRSGSGLAWTEENKEVTIAELGVYFNGPGYRIEPKLGNSLNGQYGGFIGEESFELVKPQKMNTYGLNIGDTLPCNILREWGKLGSNYISDDNTWRQGGLFSGDDRLIESFKEINGEVGFHPSGSSSFVYMKAKGFKEFMESLNKPKEIELIHGKWYKFTQILAKAKWLIKFDKKEGDRLFQLKSICISGGFDIFRQAIGWGNYPDTKDWEIADMEEVYKHFPEEAPTDGIKSIPLPKFAIGDKVNTLPDIGESCIGYNDKVPNGRIDYVNDRQRYVKNPATITQMGISSGEYWYKLDDFGNWFTEDSLKLAKEEEKWVPKVGDWVVFMPDEARRLDYYTDHWNKPYVIKVERISGGNLCFSGQVMQKVSGKSSTSGWWSNDKRCFRKALDSEIPVENSVVPEYVECIGRPGWSDLSDVQIGTIWKTDSKGYIAGGYRIVWPDGSGQTVSGKEHCFKPSTKEAYEKQENAKKMPVCDDWCVKCTEENKDVIAVWLKGQNLGYSINIGAHYGIRRGIVDYGSIHGDSSWGIVLSTEEFYKIIGYVTPEKKPMSIDPLEEAERRYPVGTLYVPLYSNGAVRHGKVEEAKYLPKALDDDWGNSDYIEVGIGYVYVNGKWAEVVQDRGMAKGDGKSIRAEFGREDNLDIGDEVEAIDQSHGWGSVNKGDIGKVTNVTKEYYVVDFPKQKAWNGKRNCFRRVGSDGQRPAKIHVSSEILYKPKQETQLNTNVNRVESISNQLVKQKKVVLF